MNMDASANLQILDEWERKADDKFNTLIKVAHLFFMYATFSLYAMKF